MTEQRICAFYSTGPHYVRMLRALRENYPDAVIVTAIPTAFPFEVIAELADETVRLPEGAQRRGIRTALHVLKQLRRARCSHVVVMFDSPRLNLLSSMSGIPHRRCYTVDGRFYRLTRRPPQLLWDAARERVRGQWDYLRAWWGTRRL